MAITAQFQDADEPVADTDAELSANQHLYGVISGCAVTYDAANMTYDIAAGSILHNGSVVAVSAQTNANTLVADSSNPRWTLISLDSTGTQVMTSGTAAATPSKPELGDNVWLAAVKIEAGQTIANNIAVKLDKRVMTHRPVEATYKYKTASQTFTTTTLTDVTATSGNIAFSIAASTAYELLVDMYFDGVGTAASGGVKLGLTGPASPTRVTVFGTYASTVAQGTDSVGNTERQTSYRSGIQTDGTTFPTFLAVNAAAADAVGGAGGAAVGVYSIRVIIINGTTAGTVTLQGAQNTAAGSTSLAYASARIMPIAAE